MSDQLKYQVITDEEIEDLFENMNFGEKINNSIHLKRLQLLKSIDAKYRGMHVGDSMFFMMTYAGLIVDERQSSLTGRGVNFRNQELNKGDKQ